MELSPRYQQSQPAWVVPAVILALAAVFAADWLTPLGYAVWIFYLLPVGLALYSSSAALPMSIAVSASALLAVGFVLSPSNVAAVPFARVNRTIGFVVIWGVAELIRRVITSRAQLRREDWLRVGQAQLSSAVQGSLRLEEVGRSVLAFLARYLDAQLGVVYLREHDVLNRIAAHASVGASETRTRFQLGEGLVGQAALTRKAAHVRNLGQGQAPIRSGLVDTLPSQLLIVPLEAEGEVNGVIELGFVHPVYPDDLALLELLAEPIGVALRASLYRTRLEDLLEETQRQAEELQQQQEELRVANEELEEQSSALQAQATSLENQQEELRQTNEELEVHTHMLTRERNTLSAAQDELERKAGEIEAASRYKSEFLANMSHELRTPLNSALILSKLLADNRGGNLTEEQVKFARNIHSSGNDLLELINDVLDLSKVEAGKMDVVVERVAVEILAQDLRKTFEPIANNKNLELQIEVEENAPKLIHSDSQRLKQILKNLLSNAVKFTAKGAVGLHIAAAGEGQISFRVTDTGIGIPLEQQSIIFEAFRQADGTTNRQYGGTGLGLSIAREFARLLGGELTVQSEPGQGSEFTLTLPQVWTATAAPAEKKEPLLEPRPWDQTPYRPKPVAPRKPAPVAASSGAITDDRESLKEGQRVLLVIEDDVTFGRILYDLGRELGFQVVVAGTAEEGMELANTCQPAAVVLDVNLPDRSGLTVLEEFKRTPAMRHVPIQVVSVGDYGQVALEMGAVGYMLKPVTRERLASALSGIAERFGTPTRKVLVVEDNAIQRESVCSLLGSEQVTAVPVSTAQAALDALRQESYDCLVLDLHLPDASGFTLLQTMAEDEAYAFPPVIIYTGRMLSADEEQLLRKYSNSIIIKGARSPERLLDEVTLFLHKVEAELPPRWQRMLADVRHRELVFENRRVLVVEDDVRNVFALQSILEPRNMTVKVARNGLEALSALAEDSDYDIVLMDIMMPGMDGLTAMREIRKQPHLRKLPILALTAKAMPDDHKACLDAGANDYISKPLEVERLLSLMRVWMGRHKIR